MNTCKERGAQWAIRTSDEDLCDICSLEHELQRDGYRVQFIKADWMYVVRNKDWFSYGDFKSDVLEAARMHRDGELN